MARQYGAKTRTIDLSQHFNFPSTSKRNQWWKDLAEKVYRYPSGLQRPWGIPFRMGGDSGPRVISVTKDLSDVVVDIGARADYLCFLHEWNQLPETVKMEDPQEGLVVAEYMLKYLDGSNHAQLVRGRFEVAMAESPGPPWLAQPFNMFETIDPAAPPPELKWGDAQPGFQLGWGIPLIYAMPNPYPKKKIKSLVIRGLCESPLIVAGLTLYQGSAHPLSHLPRRTYRIETDGKLAKIAQAEVDMGIVARIERTLGPRDGKWLGSPYPGLTAKEPEWAGEDLIELVGAPDATVSVTLEGTKRPIKFSLGEAFYKGKSEFGSTRLRILGKRRQWMKVRIIDTSTGQPTPARVHFSGSAWEYIAPYGHHSQINANWFED